MTGIYEQLRDHIRNEVPVGLVTVIDGPWVPDVDPNEEGLHSTPHPV